MKLAEFSLKNKNNEKGDKKLTPTLSQKTLTAKILLSNPSPIRI